jgi:hypothetical protein
MNSGLHPVEAIKFTAFHNYACSLCEREIPENYYGVLQDWQSAEVAGMFCSEAHAIKATRSEEYRARFAF